jgi:DNA-binding NtrC family response regulator
MPDIEAGAAYDQTKEYKPNVRVLLLSGYSIHGEATQILKRGCNGFVQKPFTMMELSEMTI